MARSGNLNIVVNSKFNPLSFDEIAKPYLMYKQEFDSQQSALAELDAKASVWENMADEEKDPLAYAQYKAYANNLRDAAYSLSTRGLTPGNKGALMALKGDYSARIQPIETAYTRKQKLAEEQRQGRAKGLIYDYDASNTSLDDFMLGKADYRSVDKNTLYQESERSFGNIAKSLNDYGLGKPVDTFTKTLLQENGVTRADAMNFINDIREGRTPTGRNAKLMESVYNALYNNTGVQSWDNTDAQNEVRNTILSAATAAFGQSDIKTIDDFKAREDYKFNNEIKAYKRKKEIDNAALGTPPPDDEEPALYDTFYVNTANQEAKDKDYNDEVWKYINNTDDGNGNANWFMNFAGRKKYQEELKALGNAVRASITSSLSTGGSSPRSGDIKKATSTIQKLYGIDQNTAAAVIQAIRNNQPINEALSEEDMLKVGADMKLLNTGNYRIANWVHNSGTAGYNFNQNKGTIPQEKQEEFNYMIGQARMSRDDRNKDTSQDLTAYTNIDETNASKIYNLMSNAAQNGKYQNMTIDYSGSAPAWKTGSKDTLPEKSKFNMSSARLLVNSDLGSYYELKTNDGKAYLFPVQGASGATSNSNTASLKKYTQAKRGYDKYIRSMKSKKQSVESIQQELQSLKTLIQQVHQMHGLDGAEAWIDASFTGDQREAAKVLLWGFDNSKEYNKAIRLGTNDAIRSAAQGLVELKLEPNKIDSESTISFPSLPWQ